MNDSPDKSAASEPPVHPGEIALLLITRSRTKSLAEVFASLKANTVRKDKTLLWGYVDDDDEPTLEAIKKGEFVDPGFPVHWHIGPRPSALGQTHEALLAACGGTFDICMTPVDDARFATHGWDEVIRAKFQEYPDGVLLAFPHDPMTADLATYPILGWKWIRALGKIYPTYFPYWFGDTWLHQIACMAGRCEKLAMNLEPIGGKGRTHRMRNHSFWTRFFQLTLEERKESARTLLAAIHGSNSEALKTALQQMETTAAIYAKEKEEFSDAYCVFQEERHSGLSPQEKNQFDPRSFKAQSVAVERLIRLAQEAMARKNFSEAIEYLDATLFSDLRVRHVNLLKVECLRALGRTTEADQLSKEAVNVWPQINPLRRAFRFMGMIATEGKRMLVGATAEGKKEKNITK